MEPTVTTPEAVPPVPTDVEPVKTEEKPLVSPQFAALAKKEKAIFKKSQELAEKQKANELFRKEAEEKLSKWDKLRTEAKLNPLEALKELGLEYKDVTEFILNNEKPTANAEIERVKAEIQAIRKSTEEEKANARKQAQEMQEKQAQETIAEFKQQINHFVETNKEEYDLITLMGAEELIYQGIEDVYNESKKVPSIKEAAEQVQKFLIEKLDAAVSGSKWFKDKYAPRAQVPAPTDAPRSTETITNTMSPSMASTMPAATEAERIKRALAALG